MTPLLVPTPDIPGTPRNYNQGKGQDAFGVSAPQLIMPEIMMPIRRPFTERGKRIGKLKILVTGDSGIGKSSLIKSVVQICEDIVHVDPISSNISTSGRHNTTSYTGRRPSDSETTKQITEVFASTRAYPQWWDELDEGRMLRRRSKGGPEEQIIERNLCFVDTPGYGSGTSFLECIEPVVRYVEAQFERTQSLLGSGEGDLMPLISGDGPPHVDIVFYVILHRLKPVDIEFIRRLSPYTNVLPVIAKSDTLTPQQLQTLKVSILNDLRSAGIRSFTFNLSPGDLKNSTSDSPTPSAPFAISSAIAPDTDTMDASVLMSPDYVPPLVDTELSHLVSTVFNPENISWLKHATAKKFINWRVKGSPSHSMIQRPLQSGGNSSQLLTSGLSGQNTAHNSLILTQGPESYQLARLADHTQREERLAKVRLSRWATDLQKSLQAERERYERLARGERAIWLTERLSEVVADGQLIPVSQLQKGKSKLPRAPGMMGPGGMNAGMSAVDTRDPFGILRLNEGVVRRLVVLVKVSGMAGLVGLVSVWVYKQWGVSGLEILQQLD
ncbi:Septin-domain-containing protein [Ascodesmis nigricans]|uniref:Septin-domain-containing protein n=1 Tax=Ascodesmis nigricans TaxID=341454 RepID=A0A4S2MQ04_9PEZI|nr:Septin-domain-containing protein [Ascodesmis nigricans]